MGSVCILQCGQKAVNIYLSFPSLWNKHLRLCCHSDNVSILIPLFKGDIYFLLQPYRGPELKCFACLCRPPGNIKHTETDKKLWSLCLKLGAEKQGFCLIFSDLIWKKSQINLLILHKSILFLSINSDQQGQGTVTLLPHNGHSESIFKIYLLFLKKSNNKTTT